jgi:hypothetical protein
MGKAFRDGYDVERKRGKSKKRACPLDKLVCGEPESIRAKQTRRSLTPRETLQGIKTLLYVNHNCLREE